MAKRKAGDRVNVKGVPGTSVLVERVKGEGWLIKDDDGTTRAVRDERIT